MRKPARQPVSRTPERDAYLRFVRRYALHLQRKLMRGQRVCCARVVALKLGVAG